ncbi:MAG: hypothetical protein HY862_02810 [Chloroflexi bacterium]|nr:hypothetical protein [Chloroflexota bacterium]
MPFISHFGFQVAAGDTNPTFGPFIATGADNMTRIWDTNSKKCIATLELDSIPIWSVAWSPDGKWLALGGVDGYLTWVEWVQDKPMVVTPPTTPAVSSAPRKWWQTRK